MLRPAQTTYCGSVDTFSDKPTQRYSRLRGRFNGVCDHYGKIVKKTLGEPKWSDMQFGLPKRLRQPDG
jgi:hypothetical protein